MPSVSTNPITTTVNSAIDGVFSVGVNLAESSIKTAVPWLGWPIIGTVVNWIVYEIANRVYQYFSLFVSFEIINIQTGAELSESQKALAALKDAQLKGDQVAIATALKNFQDATKSLLHFDGASGPGSV